VKLLNDNNLCLLNFKFFKKYIYLKSYIQKQNLLNLIFILENILLIITIYALCNIRKYCIESNFFFKKQLKNKDFLSNFFCRIYTISYQQINFLYFCFSFISKKITIKNLILMMIYSFAWISKVKEKSVYIKLRIIV
jgi:hypothetical protein